MLAPITKTKLHRFLYTIVVALWLTTIITSSALAGVLKLNGPLPTNHKVLDFKISPDGAWVVYTTGEVDGQPKNLYSVPAAGGTAQLLYSSSFIIRSWAISGDDQRVALTVAVSPMSNNRVLFSVKIDGSDSATAISPTTGSDAVVFGIAPNGQTAVYNNSADAVLYRVPITGAASPQRINPPLTSVSWLGGPPNFHFSADGNYLVYRATLTPTNTSTLYSFNLTTLTNTQIEGGIGQVESFTISPASNRVLYRWLPSGGEAELHSTPITAMQSTQLFTFTTGVDSSWGFVSGENIIIVGQKESTTRADVYRLPVDGPASAAVRLNDLALTTDSVKGVLVANNTVAFWTGTSSDRTVYAVPLAGPPTAGKLLAENAYVPELSRDGQTLVYVTNPLTQTLHSVSTTSDISSTISLTTDTVSAFTFRLSPNSTRVVYASQRSGSWELYSVPIGGPLTETVKINGPLVAGGNIDLLMRTFEFSPSGMTVIYRADQEIDNVVELFSTDTGNLLTQKLYLPLVTR